MTALQEHDRAFRTRPLARLLQPAILLRYFEAGRRLRPTQALHWILRRSVGRRYRVPVRNRVDLRTDVAMDSTALQIASGLIGNSFIFLNEPHRFPGCIDWKLTSQSRLWTYNLHYFDYALDPSRDPAWVTRTMLDWITEVPPQKSVGWEPYPASLRIVNWIKFALTRSSHGELDESWRTSLYQQVAWLERNLEHEIQANHLLKNAKAMFFGGAYFAGPAADRWLRKGLQLLLRESRDQFLADGGHYERSAMYHAIALEDLLDVLMLAISTGQLIPDRSMRTLLRTAQSALSYLNELTYPNGALPMFNDSVAGIAKDITDLTDYARGVFRDIVAIPPEATRVIDKPQVGYYGYRHGNEMLLIDAGPLGPLHQPGHGHCDALSFELVIGGNPVIVDSGVYDYESTDFRLELRRTAAHNTVRIDGEEQSDVWGCFRVGRRAEPGNVQLKAALPFEFHFQGTHDGYRHLHGHPIHHRTIECRIGNSWCVTDHIQGKGRHMLESFIHFHPDLSVQHFEDNWIVANSMGRTLYRVSVPAGHSDLLQTTYCPAFGVQCRNTALRISMLADLPTSFGYVIEVV